MEVVGSSNLLEGRRRGTRPHPLPSSPRLHLGIRIATRRSRLWDLTIAGIVIMRSLPMVCLVLRVGSMARRRLLLRLVALTVLMGMEVWREEVGALGRGDRMRMEARMAVRLLGLGCPLPLLRFRGA